MNGNGIAAEAKTPTALRGVPETLLWTLYQRALEAGRTDAVLRDPLAVDLVGRIDYPFEERFGGPSPLSQWQALRTRTFDAAVGRFLGHFPDGVVVALGEGLETQFWRVDNGRVRWVGVDLPETIELRRRLLPESPRRTTIAGSALDADWMDEVDAGRGVLITTQGLLMYLRPEEVHAVIAACAARFPGGGIVFDTVPPWFSALTTQGRMRTPGGFVSPPMPWAFDVGERAAVGRIPGVAVVRELRIPRGRGPLFGWALPALQTVPAIRRRLLSIHVAGFG
jgi:O-methyltransferase involved in polyketide biosynthesis